jgi:hypothetical protein
LCRASSGAHKAFMHRVGRLNHLGAAWLMRLKTP